MFQAVLICISAIQLDYAIVVNLHAKNVMIVQIVSHVNKIIIFMKHFAYNIVQQACGVILTIEHVNINAIYLIGLAQIKFV